jgi:hypothetical protein
MPTYEIWKLAARPMAVEGRGIAGLLRTKRVHPNQRCPGLVVIFEENENDDIQKGVMNELAESSPWFVLH